MKHNMLEKIVLEKLQPAIRDVTPAAEQIPFPSRLETKSQIPMKI